MTIMTNTSRDSSMGIHVIRSPHEAFGRSDTPTLSRVPRYLVLHRDDGQETPVEVGSGVDQPSSAYLVMVAAEITRTAPKMNRHKMRRSSVDLALPTSSNRIEIPLASVTSGEFRSRSSNLLEMLPWRLLLGVMNTYREIIDLLRVFKRRSIANRLQYLQELHDDDPDEPVMEIESLRTLAGLVLDDQKLPDPRLGLSPRGLAIAQWSIPPDGVLTMEFHAHDWIRFAAVGRAPRFSEHRERISGMFEKHKAVSKLRDFIELLPRQ